MYLKSIEVQGFKSFAQKIKFQFHNGITGIVGPNGSGKSNVADAVRWVLGEQRIKQLRGASMQDVIFSGTEIRKPLSYAYVAITLDNSDHQLPIDYSEVTVGRRIYRSGESEYMINGSPCRLKDVNELFYDTGIGKEGYSIIGQGQIDRIISGKPEEKRELFDEAAGIVKFKRRKNAAQKKLDDEKQNLLRLSDILAELDKQLGPLQKQSEKARIFLKKKEELKTTDVNMFLLEHDRLRGQIEKLEISYQAAAEELKASGIRYEEIKKEYEEIQNRVEELEERMEEARNTLTDTSLVRGNLEGEIKVLKEQIHSAKSNEAHLQNRLASIRELVKEAEKEKQKVTLSKEETDRLLTETRKLRQKAGDKLSDLQERIETLNQEIETGKNTIIETLNERATIKSRLERLETMLEQANMKKAQLANRMIHVKSDEEKQDRLLKELEQEFQRITENITGMNHEQTRREEELGAVRDRLADLDQKLRDTQVLYHQEKSRLEALSNLTERYEGYGSAVKRVMEQKEENKGIIGVVADIITVEKKYEVAIETALGGNIQNIVTEDEETAKKMITFLKRNKAGRATFLPLTGICNPQEFKAAGVLEEAGVIGMADELVTLEKRYRNVAKAMLGRIVVVDNVDHAVKIARKYEYTIRMVTLEGELLVPGGAISGGAFKNSSNLLGRRREMEQLSRKVRDYVAKIDDLLSEIEAVKDKRNKMRLDLEHLKGQIQDEFIRQNTARLNVSAAVEKQNETKAGAGHLQREAEELEASVTSMALDKEGIQKELEQSQALEKNVEAQVRGFQVQLDEVRQQESDQAAFVAEQDVELEKILQRQGFEQVNLSRIEGELARHLEEWKEVKDGIAGMLAEAEQKQAAMGEIEKTIEASFAAQSDVQGQLKEMMRRKEQMSSQQKNFFSVREEMSEKLTALDKEVYRLNTQKERLSESLQNQIDYMWEEYEITLHQAAVLRDEEMKELAPLKRLAASLKEEIKALGDVNVNAIQDYKNVRERHDFLKAQYDDIVESEQTLMQIIEELDTAMRRQFEEKFSMISREFDKVFKELFGGGKGSLQLMEEEDILEAGIRIIAQPPGKKLQNMMQLSGGEKALTAIALLFAIQNLKPSPFCLLDEIEAALDENNVVRFARYLHKLTKHTQFIVITHRRGTMERADRLYGITMQEKGVSALVSVNLVEGELED